MNLHHTATHIPSSYEQHHEAVTRLHRRWLVLARMLWIAISILTLVVFCDNLMVGNYGQHRSAENDD
jgi:hypothetical protein